MTAEFNGHDYVNFVREYSSFVARYLNRRETNARECAEIADETFAVVWKLWDKRPTENFEPWLTNIAQRILSNHRRSRDRRWRLAQRLAFERVDDDVDDDGSDKMKLLAAFGKLKEKDRELLRQVYWEELTFFQISLALGISENAVAIRVTRARDRLTAKYSQLNLNGDDGTDEEDVD